MKRELYILQVEDDENDIFLLERAFKKAGITNRLQVAKDGEEAINYLLGAGEFADRERYPLPCLIILDLKMPRRDGLEVLQWLRNESQFESEVRSLPVIMFSSSGLANDIDRAYKLGANSYVVKPASTEKRAELARHIKGYWLEFNESPPVCTKDESEPKTSAANSSNEFTERS